MKYTDFKDRYAAELERLCEAYPERDLDDLKREADEITKKAEVAANNNEDREDQIK